MKHLHRLVMTVAALALAQQTASAQSAYARPILPRPIISPYLNLLRSGNSPAFNYLTLVRPELEFRKAVDTIQGDLTSQSSQISAIQNQDPATLSTGHAVGYNTHLRYFMTMGGRAGGGMVGGTRPPISSTPTSPIRGARGPSASGASSFR